MGSLLCEAQMHVEAWWHACLELVAIRISVWTSTHVPGFDRETAFVQVMTCIACLDWETCYYSSNSVHPRFWQECSLWHREESRLLRCNDNHWWLSHCHHHTRLPLPYVVLSVHFPRGPVCAARVNEQWGVRPLDRVMSRRGVVNKAPEAWVISGLKAYECLRGGAEPKHPHKPDPSAKLTRGMFWSSHLETTYTRTKHKGVCQTQTLA
jgi:hypothetical protein